LLANLNGNSVRNWSEQAMSAVLAKHGQPVKETVIAELTTAVRRISKDNIAEIDLITREATYLAINALIEAARVGEAGRGFAVVANRVKDVSRRIGQLTDEFGAELAAISETMVAELERQQVQRLTDLALNLIDVIDRNLYERSCEVRWWATDAAIVDGVTSGPEAAAHASKRMSVILDRYTVYLDIWVLDLDGRVVANGRPSKSPVAELDGAQTATHATAIREGGATSGKIAGVLAVFFDWAKQASAVLDNVRLSNEERSRTRCMIVDANGRVIANSGQMSRDTKRYELRKGRTDTGVYRAAEGSLVGHALTPGYESYQGMGWFGVIEQKPHRGVGAESPG
jgi:Methyl-accepting chemotaxis protein (MCP) signalling domain